MKGAAKGAKLGGGGKQRSISAFFKQTGTPPAVPVESQIEAENQDVDPPEAKRPRRAEPAPEPATKGKRGAEVVDLLDEEDRAAAAPTAAARTAAAAAPAAAAPGPGPSRGGSAAAAADGKPLQAVNGLQRLMAGRRPSSAAAATPAAPAAAQRCTPAASGAGAATPATATPAAATPATGATMTPALTPQQRASARKKLAQDYGRATALEPTTGGGGGGGGSAVKLTPLEQQVVELRAQHPGTILVVEVGYKFRFFGEDAEVAAQVCNM
ncbi:DNA mismatch repair protein MSH3 [Tetrabaena socialis]|uniref:DNA mismatch repair protein MSH3 n=1 Tax=Tetrabaena socialis TaxID=47790 RepID=A0A2J8AHH3_9CHLO|nr:DNA mismatch repair protein MSH3 [Tetrabaena socialis]|eukprot:PNH11973.1 DNA mismatch repair protein MSH3 [Tetrabaena socialis]